MRSVSNRIALYGIASAAILTTFSHTRAVGEPTTSSSFSSVSDESSLCDESAVASKDPFEKLSRLCSVDVEYGVGPLSIISDGHRRIVEQNISSKTRKSQSQKIEEEDKTLTQPFAGEIIRGKRTNLFKSRMFSRTDKASPMVESIIAQY